MNTKGIHSAKTGLLATMLFVAISSLSCDKSGENEKNQGKAGESTPFTFNADTQDGAGDWVTKWRMGDIIYAVTEDGTWGKTENSDLNGKSIAEFAYSEEGFKTKATIPEGTHTFNLIYSGNAQKTLHRGAGSKNNLAANQVQDCNNPTAHIKNHDVIAGQIADLKTPASETINARMFHVYSLAKVTLINMTSKTFTPKSLSMEASTTLAGLHSIIYQQTPSAEYLSEGSNEISLTLLNPKELKRNESFDAYVIMSPIANYSGNLTLTVTDTDNNSYSKKLSFNNKTFAAGHQENIICEVKEDIEWGEPLRVCEGSYGRMHRLNDGRLMLVYSTGAADEKDACARFSSDMGQSWSEETIAIKSFVATFGSESTPVRCVNTEFLQLSPTHPSHPNRIIYAVNLRAMDNKSSIYPICIACSTSDDNGYSWSEPKIIYESQRWNTDVAKGAWEPFVNELQNGKVQVYFTDNTPYYKLYDSGELSDNNRRGNNISVIESEDGGDSWNDYRIVCHSEGGWDGMASVIQYQENMYLAIEHKDKRGEESMSIQLIKNSLGSNWASIETSNSKNRFYPFGHPDGFDEGAPYIVQTENHIIISCQCAEGGETTDNLVAEVRSIGKKEIDEDGLFPDRIKSKSRPMASVIKTVSTVSKKTAKWNSLCPLPNDEIYLVSEHRNAIYIVKGKIAE